LIQVLEEASAIAKKHFGKVSGTVKAGDANQVFTKTDLEIGTFIVSSLQKQYPDHNVIEEETGVIDKKSPYTWVVDPIDGTSNFISGIPMYGILVALLDNTMPIVGAVSMPEFGEVYFAEKGKGAYCNEKRLHVTREDKLMNALVAYGIDAHQENPTTTHDECRVLGDIILHVRNIRASNSVFDYMMVAKGNYGAYLNRTTKIWDNAAPQLIIEEAGGVYTDFFGKPIDYSNPLKKSNENFTFCTAAPQLHKQLQSIIHGERDEKS